MPEINLLQNRVKDTTFAWQRQIKAVLAVLTLLLILLAVGGIGLMILGRQTNAQTDETTRQNASLQSDLTKQQNELGSAQQFQAQLANLKTLLKQHVFMTSLLDEIEKVTYVKAQYVTIDASNAGKVHLEGTVSDYNSLAKLILGLNSSEQFSNIELISVSPSSGATNGYIFSIDMEVAPAIFTKK